MPIARITDVNAGRRTASAIVQGASGTMPLPDIKLTDSCSPTVNDWVIIVYDGVEYYALDTVQPETQEAVEARESQDAVPGDQVIGDPEGTGIVIRQGGLISIMADQVTGFIMNKINGLLQFMGRMFSWDTLYFHGRVRTQEDDKNTKVEVSLFGSPFESPVSTEIIQAIIDTKLASINANVNAMKDINIDFNIAPQSGIMVGPSINLNLNTPQGKVAFRVNGITGIVEVESPTIMKLSGQYIFINSDGNPLDRVLTAKDLCIYTGNMHGQGSGKVFVGP